MESAKLKIVVHAGKDLKNVSHFGTMKPYAVVWIARDGNESKFKTNVAKKGGTNPVWNCPMEFDIASMQNDYVLFCQIRNHGMVYDPIIGEVQVSFAELLAGDASGTKVSYPVKISTGEVEGEIILSHMFSELIVAGSGTSDVGGILGIENDKRAKRIADWTAEVACQVAAGVATAVIVSVLV